MREKTENPAEISHIRRGARIISGLVVSREIEVYEVNGPFFFGAADKLRDILDELARPPKVFILRMRNVPTIDATGIHALEQLCIKAKAGGRMIILSGVQREPFRAIVRGARRGHLRAPQFHARLQDGRGARKEDRCGEIVEAVGQGVRCRQLELDDHQTGLSS